MIVNRYSDKLPSIRHTLENMVSRFPYFKILNFQPESRSEDLHAKIIVVDRRKALVGSANLTWKGLVGNHELAVIVSGSIAFKIAVLFDKLCCDLRSTKVGI